jgi:hypothetical protein
MAHEESVFDEEGAHGACVQAGFFVDFPDNGLRGVFARVQPSAGEAPGVAFAPVGVVKEEEFVLFVEDDGGNAHRKFGDKGGDDGPTQAFGEGEVAPEVEEEGHEGRGGGEGKRRRGEEERRSALNFGSLWDVLEVEIFWKGRIR